MGSTVDLKKEYPKWNEVDSDDAVCLNRKSLESSNVRVIGQVHSKLIVCFFEKENIFVNFDQHAIHERILFEIFCNSTLTVDKKLYPRFVEPPIEYHIPLSLMERVKLNQALLDKWLGLKFDIKSHPVQDDLFCICIKQVPYCFRNYDDRSIFLKFFDEALRLLETKSATSSIPSIRITPFLLHELRLQACRDAIAPNVRITNKRCKFLIEQLSECKAPFKCVHNRLSVSPIDILPQTLEENTCSMNVEEHDDSQSLIGCLPCKRKHSDSLLA